MFYKNNCYIYLEARAVISHREDFRIIDTPKSFRISKTILSQYKITFIFSNVAGLCLQSVLRSKQFLKCIFKTPILRTSFSLKNIWCFLK